MTIDNKKKFIEFYKKEAKYYDNKRFNCECKNLYDKIIKEIVHDFLKDCKYVLDAGCGTGRFSIFLAQKGVKVSALDTSEEMLIITKEKAQKNGVSKRITFTQGNIESIPYSNNTFDGLCSIHVLTHFSSVEKVIHEFSRVLKKDGYIVFEITNGIFAKTYYKIKRTVTKKNFYFLDYYHGYRQIRDLLLRNGIEIVEYKNYKKIPIIILHILLCRLHLKFLRKPIENLEKLNFGSVTVIKGKKIR